MSDLRPRVSVGIPVYNGENFLRQAIEALLAQTYTDFELLISDNGSTDGTEAICREYAARDRRVRYARSETNRGAAWNHNVLVERARGELFCWNAHDDLHAPTFLERCVAVLDADLGAVLAYPLTRIIDEHGHTLRDFDMPLRTDSPYPHIRFHDAICVDHSCYQVYGVMRIDALRRTQMIGNFSGSDWPLLGELALRGRYIEVREYLFMRREHSQVSTKVFKANQDMIAWFDPKKAGKITFPHWRLFYEYIRAVGRAPLSLHDRVRCYAVCATWLPRRSYSGKQRWRLLTGDLKVAARRMGYRARQAVSQRFLQHSVKEGR